MSPLIDVLAVFLYGLGFLVVIAIISLVSTVGEPIEIEENKTADDYLNNHE